jgi:hypothetical protein
MRPIVLAALVLSAGGCAPSRQYTNADVPNLTKLEDIMWAQAQVSDPQFSKADQNMFTDGEYQDLSDMATRLQLTTARIKKDFSKGPEFDSFADTLSNRAVDLGAAAGAKDIPGVSKSLHEIQNTCRGCHKKFR